MWRFCLFIVYLTLTADFDVPSENGFSTNIKFDSYKSVASYIYEL